MVAYLQCLEPYYLSRGESAASGNPQKCNLNTIERVLVSAKLIRIVIFFLFLVPVSPSGVITQGPSSGG